MASVASGSFAATVELLGPLPRALRSSPSLLSLLLLLLLLLPLLLLPMLTTRCTGTSSRDGGAVSGTGLSEPLSRRTCANACL